MGKVLFLKSDRMGRGNEDLGRLLMHNFLYTLARSEAKPSAVYLVNDAVRLACGGSAEVAELGLLAEAGVGVYACGTCLDYLGLKESLEAGNVGTMPSLVAAMLDAGDVVTVS